MKKQAMKETLIKISSSINEIEKIHHLLLNNEMWLHHNKSLELKKLTLLFATYRLHIEILLANVLKKELNKE